MQEGLPALNLLPRDEIPDRMASAIAKMRELIYLPEVDQYLASMTSEQQQLVNMFIQIDSRANANSDVWGELARRANGLTPRLEGERLTKSDKPSRLAQELYRRDPNLELSIQVILSHILQSKFERYTNFTIPHMARIFGVSPIRLTLWEEEKKIIRTGTLADGRHPTFNLKEAVLIGYINIFGNHLSRRMCSELREIVSGVLKQTSQT